MLRVGPPPSKGCWCPRERGLNEFTASKARARVPLGPRHPSCCGLRGQEDGQLYGGGRRKGGDCSVLTCPLLCSWQGWAKSIPVGIGRHAQDCVVINLKIILPCLLLSLSPPSVPCFLIPSPFLATSQLISTFLPCPPSHLSPPLNPIRPLSAVVYASKAAC